MICEKPVVDQLDVVGGVPQLRIPVSTKIIIFDPNLNLHDNRTSGVGHGGSD